jgi:hypothetical protein
MLHDGQQEDCKGCPHRTPLDCAKTVDAECAYMQRQLVSAEAHARGEVFRPLSVAETARLEQEIIKNHLSSWEVEMIEQREVKK